MRVAPCRQLRRPMQFVPPASRHTMPVSLHDIGLHRSLEYPSAQAVGVKTTLFISSNSVLPFFPRRWSRPMESPPAPELLERWLVLPAGSSAIRTFRAGGVTSLSKSNLTLRDAYNVFINPFAVLGGSSPLSSESLTAIFLSFSDGGADAVLSFALGGVSQLEISFDTPLHESFHIVSGRGCPRPRNSCPFWAWSHLLHPLAPGASSRKSIGGARLCSQQLTLDALRCHARPS